MKRTAIALAICSARPARVAVAPCFFQVDLANAAATELVEIQVTPAGAFRPMDGRALPVDAWYIDAAIAERVIARFRARSTPPVLDYEHQTLLAEKNGQPAPAAGRFRELEWREGQGLFALVELTPRARQFIADGEYRFFSPVFHFSAETGEVLALQMGALTNNPALDGMAPIELRAAACFALQTEEEETPMKLLHAICATLGLAATTTEDQAIAALTALKDKPDPLADVRAALKLADDTNAEGVVAACTSLQAKAAVGAADPSKFVSVDVVEQLKGQIAVLTATNTQRSIDDLVKPALEDGRLLPAQEKWARELGATNLASLTAYLSAAQPIAALTNSQTRGKQPDVSNEHGLTADELAVCTAAGISPADFAKNKAQA